MKLFLHAFKRFQALKFIKYLLFGLYDGGDKKLKSERKLKHIKLWCTLLGHRFLLLASLRFYQSFLTFVSAIARQRVKIWQTSYKREGKLPKVFQYFITSSATRPFEALSEDRILIKPQRNVEWSDNSRGFDFFER